MRILGPVALALLTILGCAGGNAAKPDAHTGGEEGTPSEPPKKSGAPDVEASHRRFVTGCATTPDLGAYCECAWGAMAKMFTPEELANDEKPSEETMAKIKAGVSKACSDKMPEATLREGFVNGCKKGDPQQLESYCVCMYTELRKVLSPAEFEQQEITPKLNGAIRTGAKACSSKLSATSMRAGFLKECTQKPGRDAFCACAWKSISTRASLGEIQSTGDSPEMKPIYEDMMKECRKHLPAGG